MSKQYKIGIERNLFKGYLRTNFKLLLIAISMGIISHCWQQWRHLAVLNRSCKYIFTKNKIFDLILVVIFRESHQGPML
jgi:hypothetical protein